jgi:hypothetical protein
MGNVLDDAGSIPDNARFFVLHSIQADSEAHPASYPTGTGDSFPGEQAAGGEADRSPPYNAKVKKGGAIPPLLHML